jgi:hypothetical protein
MAPDALLSRPYSLAEVCHATQMKPGAFKQLVHRGILAPVHRPPPGAHRGYRLVEIWSAALIMELGKCGYLQMQAAVAVASIVVDKRQTFWSNRDLNTPSLLLVYSVSENQANGLKVRSQAELSNRIERTLKDPAFPIVSTTLLNVTKVLFEVDNRLRELVTAPDEQTDDDAEIERN